MVSAHDATKSETNLVWIDCEMTGLEPSKHVILEIATIVTTSNLDLVAIGPELTIKPSEADLALMDEWARDTHAKSGLLDRVNTTAIPLRRAEEEILAFLNTFCYERKSPLCGNSIGQDKIFLAAYMPRVHSFLHYRIIDVSSIKLLVQYWYGGKHKPPDKRESHRALVDIQESIAELQYYRTFVFVP